MIERIGPSLVEIVMIGKKRKSAKPWLRFITNLNYTAWVCLTRQALNRENMCLSIHLVSSMVCFVVMSNFFTILVGMPVIKEPLSEHANDDF